MGMFDPKDFYGEDAVADRIHAMNMREAEDAARDAREEEEESIAEGFRCDAERYAATLHGRQGSGFDNERLPEPVAASLDGWLRAVRRYERKAA